MKLYSFNSLPVYVRNNTYIADVCLLYGYCTTLERSFMPIDLLMPTQILPSILWAAMGNLRRATWCVGGDGHG